MRTLVKRDELASIRSGERNTSHTKHKLMVHLTGVNITPAVSLISPFEFHLQGGATHSKRKKEEFLKLFKHNKRGVLHKKGRWLLH